jgi:hypothetical protein
MITKACDGASPLNKALQIYLGPCSFFYSSCCSREMFLTLFTSSEQPRLLLSCIAISIEHVRVGLVAHGTLFDWWRAGRCLTGRVGCTGPVTWGGSVFDWLDFGSR